MKKKSTIEETLRAWKWPITLLTITAAFLWIAVVGLGEQLGIHEDARQQLTGVAGFLSMTVCAPILRWLFRDEDKDGTPDVFQKGTGLVALLAIGLALSSLTACNSVRRAEVANALDETLNVTTDVAQPLYDLTVISCHSVEMLLIEHGEEAAPTREKVEKVRATCDGLFASFASLRDLQRSLRTAVDDLRRGELELAIVLTKVGPIRALVTHLKEAIQAFRRENGLPEEPIADVDRPPAYWLARAGATS